MRSKFLIVAILGVLVGGLSALLVDPNARRALFGSGPPVSTGKALIGGPFSLIDQNGKRVSERDFKGRPMLVMFGFTSCPDICPAGLQVLTAAIERLGDVGKTITPVFISLDPERDTSPKLKDYLSNFHPSLVGLTGTTEEVAAAAKAYRVYFKKVADEKGIGYTIDHSSFYYLMDRTGVFVTHAPHSTSAEALAVRLKSVL